MQYIHDNQVNTVGMMPIPRDDHTDSSLIAPKATAMGVLFLAAVFAGLLPSLLAYFLKWNGVNPSKGAGTIISMLLALGGGVLLATTFLHLLPEVREAIESLQSTKQMFETSFPLAEFLMCVGFFTIYLVSELVHTYIGKHKKYAKNVEAAFTRGHSFRESALVKGHEAVSYESDLEAHKNQTETSNQNTAIHQHSHVHLPACDTKDDFITSSLRGLLIVLALSIHELFEGMALGLENSASDVWLFFGAIASHKLVLAFCVGVELIVARTNKKLAVCYILIFGIVSPIGIGIGMLVSESVGSLIAGAVLRAMATGTLVFVVFFEILKKSGSGLLQFAAVLLGFFVMFGLQQIAGHDHNHSDDDDHDDHGDDHGHSHDDHSHIDGLRQKIDFFKAAASEIRNSFTDNNKEKDE